MFRYSQGISKGIEVNTSLLIYKNIIRSVIDYVLFIYYSKEENLSILLRRTQFLGIRIVLGFRQSTPTNILIAEAGVILPKDRASYLAENFMLKTIIYGRKVPKEKIEKYVKEKKRGDTGI